MSDDTQEPRSFLDGSGAAEVSSTNPDSNTPTPTPTAAATLGVTAYAPGAPQYYRQDPLAGQPVGYPPSRPEPENTSGMLADVPPEVEKLKWHWGAALLSTYWAKEHGIDHLANNWGAFWVIWFVSGLASAWGFQGAWIIRVLCFLAVPVVTIFFGMVGYREGWRYRRFEGGVPEYLEVQRDWTRKALIITPLVIVGFIGVIGGCVWYITANMPGGYFTQDHDSVPTATSTLSAPPTYHPPTTNYVPYPTRDAVKVPQPGEPAQPYGASTGTYTPPESTQQQPATNANPAPAVDQSNQNYGSQSGGNQPNQNAAPANQSNPNYGNPPANTNQTQPTATDQSAQTQAGADQNQTSPPSAGSTPQPSSADQTASPPSNQGGNPGGQPQPGASGQ